MVWRELMRRAQRNNAGTELGEALEKVARITAEDVVTFEEMMRDLGLRRNPVKTRLAILSERVGRLKPNGHVRRYSPLSRFIELDAIVVGVVGKKILWENLRDLAELGTRLPGVDFDELIARAEAQINAVERFRLEAGRASLGTG